MATWHMMLGWSMLASGADRGNNDANNDEQSDSCDGNNDNWSDDTDLSVT